MTSPRHLAGLLLATTLAAQSTPPPIEPALRARFGFLGPEIHKVGEGLGLLHSVDLDGNGRAEAVVNDARRGRLHALALGEDGLKANTLPTRGQIQGVAFGDFDADGVQDLAVLDLRGRLLVTLRGPGKAALEPIEVGQGLFAHCLETGDLDGDGKVDVVVATREGLRVVRQLDRGGMVAPPIPVEEGSRSLEVMDLDGDRRLDVVLVTPAERMALRVKFGRGDGSFGPWVILGAENLRTAFAGTGAGGRPTLATIEGPHRRVAEYILDPRSERGALLFTALPGGGRDAPPFAHGDVDGDGDPDLVLADRERASLTVLLEENGDFVVRSFPTLAGVSCLALGDLDGDGRNDLVLTSPDEDALAWKSGAKPLDAFPERLPCTNKPVAVAVHGGRAVVLTRDDKRKARVDAVPAPGKGGAAALLLQIDRLAADPARLVLGEFDDLPGVDLVFVVPGEGLRAFRGSADGLFTPLDQSGEAAGFTRRMEDGALAASPDGKAVFVVRDRFARTFRFDAEGRPAILAQDNGPEGAAALNLGTTLGDGTRLYVDRKGGKLHRLAKDTPPASLDLPPIEFGYLLAHQGGALLLGAKGVLRVPFTQGPGLRMVRSHEPPTDKTQYFHGIAADLDGDGTKELVLVDAHLSGLQVLVAQAGKLERALAFPVFERPAEEERESEPRELVSGDFNGDGLADLAVLCHDRVLVYVSER